MKKKLALATQALEVNRLLAHPLGLHNDEDVFGVVAELVDTRSSAAEDLLIEAENLERIFVSLGRLEEREATVLRMRFGLDPYAPMTLKEVGENLGLTRERVRQIHKSAIQTLVDECGDTASEEPLWGAIAS